MRIKMMAACFLFLVLSLSCKKSANQDTKLVELITVEEMDTLLQMGRVQLVDVRTPQEYKQGHLPNAINIDFRNKNFETLISAIDKTKPVAVYCARGGRSAKCSALMKKAGFTKIYDLDGGITEWKFKGKKIIK